MSAEKDTAGDLLPQELHGTAQALAVALRIPGKRRSMRTLLTEGQVAAQDGEPGFSKSAGHRRQQPRTAVCACTMGKHQAVPIRLRRDLEEAAHRRLGAQVRKGADGSRGLHGLIVRPG
jgi:hypothetical protein